MEIDCAKNFSDLYNTCRNQLAVIHAKDFH